MWVSMMIGLHAVIHSQVVIHDTVTVCPDTSSMSGQPAHPLAKSEIHFFYEPVYNPCGELTYCRPGLVDGVYDPCGGGCYTFSPDFSEVTYTSQIRSAVIPLINLSESGGSIAFDVSRPQSEIGHRIFAYHLTNRPDLRVCWGADPTTPPIGTGTLNVAYGERLFFALQEDVYSPGHVPVEITPICPYEFMVRFENPDVTLWVNGFETGMATYEVVPDTENVAHGTAVPLDVIAWKQHDEGTEEIPETAELDFTFMSGAEYGTYIGPDSLQADTLHNILYRDVKAGRVQFLANGENPEGSELVIFSVNASGKECPAGAGIAFIQSAEKIRLVADKYRLNPLRNGQNKDNPNYNVNGDERKRIIDFSKVDTDSVHIYVSDAMDKPIQDYPITITALVVDRSGGHDHSGNRPTGKFIYGQDTLTTDRRKTDASGSLHYKYLSSGFGGIDSICVEGETRSDTATAKILLKRNDFQLLTEGEHYRLVGRTDTHKVNHYATSNTITKLKQLADSVFADSSYILQYNDMSLINGGPFDYSSKYPWDTPHLEHRNGNNVDMRPWSADADSTKIDADYLERKVKKLFKGNLCEECKNTSNHHFHLTF